MVRRSWSRKVLPCDLPHQSCTYLVTMQCDKL